MEDLGVEATDKDEVHCECGECSGERCAWSGPESDTVVIEFMPEWCRQSHIAARNHGAYPLNGARRIRVAPTCAESIRETDPEWTNIIGA